MKVILALIVCLFAAIAYAHEADNIIHITDVGFVPSKLEIEQEMTVEFENIGKNPHWPASNIHPTHEIYSEFDPKDVIQPGESWSFTFDKAGEWRFHDHAYPEFIGTIIVIEKDSFLNSVKGFFTDIFKSPLITALIFWDGEEISPYNESIEITSEDIFRNDSQLYSYIKKFGVKQTTAFLHQLEGKHGDCHQTAHRLGRFAYQLYANDVFQQCSIECHSGCYHGAIEYYFKEYGTTDIPTALNTICGNQENGFFAHQCFHGIGHGLMAWTDYELLEALQKCDLLQDGKNSCYTGAFMENVVASLAENKSTHVSKYVNDDPQYPCSIVEDKYKWDCYFFQTARMKEIFNNDFRKVAEACADAPEAYQRNCFESMGRDISGNTIMNVDKSIELCQSAPPKGPRIACLKGAVQDMFWDSSGQDKSLSFCKKLTDLNEKSECYNTIFERAPLVISSQEELKMFCEKAEERYQNSCLTQTHLE